MVLDMETILVIDDELFFRQLCEDILSLRGFRVLTAESARAGLDELDKGGIDVVLLDVMVPELSGIELLPIMKRKDPSLSIIMMTASASLETAIEALRQGAYDYLRKPFQPHELYHTLDKAIRHRRLELENKRLLQKLQLEVNELSTLNRVGQYIHSLLDIDRLLDRLVLAISDLMGVEVISVMLIEKETGEMAIRASKGIPDEVVKTARQKVGEGIAGWVVERGEPLLVNDIDQDPRFAKLPRPASARYLKSLMSVPLVTKEGVIGVLNVGSKVSGEPFTDHDLQLLTTFSSQASAAIENAELYAKVKAFNRELQEQVQRATSDLAKSNQELEGKVKELSTLYEASRAISSTLNPRELAVKMLEQVRRLVPYDLGKIMILEEETRELKSLAASPEEGGVMERHRLDEYSSTAWIGRNQRPLLIPEIRPGIEVSMERWKWGREPMHSYIGVPLLKGERLIGTIELANRGRGAFHEGCLNTLTALASQLAVSLENASLYSSIERNTVITLQALVRTLEARDDYTGNHSERVSRVAVLIAKQMGLSERSISLVERGAQLHDIGKIWLDDQVLKSDEKLTPEQRKRMEEHPTIGAQILEPIPFLHPILSIVRHHHERYDGRGYPGGLAGEDIPLEARIVTVADSYDAMMSRRRYRRKIFTYENIADEFQRNAGTQFDPQVVEAFLGIGEEELREIYPLSTSAEGGLIPVECSGCGNRFRVDRWRISEAGADVKCHKCHELIFVKPPIAPTA